MELSNLQRQVLHSDAAHPASSRVESAATSLRALTLARGGDPRRPRRRGAARCPCCQASAGARLHGQRRHPSTSSTSVPASTRCPGQQRRHPAGRAALQLHLAGGWSRYACLSALFGDQGPHLCPRRGCWPPMVGAGGRPAGARSHRSCWRAWAKLQRPPADDRRSGWQLSRAETAQTPRTARSAPGPEQRQKAEPPGSAFSLGCWSSPKGLEDPPSLTFFMLATWFREILDEGSASSGRASPRTGWLARRWIRRCCSRMSRDCSSNWRESSWMLPARGARSASPPSAACPRWPLPADRDRAGPATLLQLVPEPVGCCSRRCGFTILVHQAVREVRRRLLTQTLNDFPSASPGCPLPSWGASLATISSIRYRSPRAHSPSPDRSRNWRRHGAGSRFTCSGPKAWPSSCTGSVPARTGTCR